MFNERNKFFEDIEETDEVFEDEITENKDIKIKKKLTSEDIFKKYRKHS